MATKSKQPAKAARKSGRSKELPPVAPTADPIDPPAGAFNIGDRVTHHMFGDGVVEATRDLAVRVKFKKFGSKNILESYLKRLR